MNAKDGRQPVGVLDIEYNLSRSLPAQKSEPKLIFCLNSLWGESRNAQSIVISSDSLALNGISRECGSSPVTEETMQPQDELLFVLGDITPLDAGFKVVQPTKPAALGTSVQPFLYPRNEANH